LLFLSHISTTINQTKKKLIDRQSKEVFSTLIIE
ncbi:MAG: hypothetical protein ACI8RD_008348, partial [Bacillariaceae sp.]